MKMSYIKKMSYREKEIYADGLEKGFLLAMKIISKETEFQSTLYKQVCRYFTDMDIDDIDD